MMRMAISACVLVLVATMPLVALDATTTGTTTSRKLVLKKTQDVSLEGAARFTKAKVWVSDNRKAILVDQWNGGNLFIPLGSKGGEVQTIGVPGWNRPSMIPQTSRIVTKTWGRVMVSAPRDATVNQLAAMPHEMNEGDWIDPVVSPRGDILATRPTIKEVQFWDLKTLKPLTEPLIQPTRVSRISFTSDGKYFRVHDGNYISILDPRTGKIAAEPRLSGPFRYYPSSPGTYFFGRPRAAYEPGKQQIVYFHNSGKDTSLKCKAAIHSLTGKSKERSFELDVHAYQATWIDADHLLVQGGRKLETNWYNTYPLLLVSLKNNANKITELHPNVNHYGVSPDGKHIVATIREHREYGSVCWKLNQKKPLWTGSGSFAGFGEDGWVLTHNQGRTATVRSIKTGDALWERPKIQVARPKGQHVWLFFEESFQSWKAEWQ